MRAIVKISSYAVMVALFLTVALAGPVAAKNTIRFNGFFQGLEIDVVQGTTLLVDGVGTGLATHLGKFTVTREVTVNLVNGRGIGSAHFIAANGDSIFTDIVGRGEPTETPGVNRIKETNTITGGTGQFAGASPLFYQPEDGTAGRNSTAAA
jgi:hypothetical protein